MPLPPRDEDADDDDEAGRRHAKEGRKGLVVQLLPLCVCCFMELYIRSIVVGYTSSNLLRLNIYFIVPVKSTHTQGGSFKVLLEMETGSQLNCNL